VEIWVLRAGTDGEPAAGDDSVRRTEEGLGLAYTSKIRVLGLPLFEYQGGSLVEGSHRRGVARAWIAVGDIAFGVLFSAGGVAVGGVAVGGLSAGLVSAGGLALGGLALGGGAVGVWSVGGAAFALHAALGGLAVGGAYAEGGAAVARHANDSLANAFFTRNLFFRLSKSALSWSWVLIALPVLFALSSRRRPPRQG
jgi:hypothetical protein